MVLLCTKRLDWFSSFKEYLGDDDFDRIMQKYFNEWKFKHPQPEDLKSLLNLKRVKM